MAQRSGPWVTLREPATYAANLMLYPVDVTFEMGKNANCIMLYFDVSNGTPGYISAFAQHSPDGGKNWYNLSKPFESPKLFGSVPVSSVNCCPSIELAGINLPPNELIKVWFLCEQGAGVVSLGIKALAYDSGTKPLNGPEPDFLTRVAQRRDPRYDYVYKFGDNPDVDTGTTPEDIWTFGGDYVYSTSADIDTISSSDATDVGQPIVVIGQTLDYTEITQVVVTNGQNKVTLPTPLYRCYRMLNVSSQDLAGTLYAYVDGAITAGVPNDPATVRAVIDNGDNQTQMAIYTIPKNMTAYAIGGDVTFSRAVTAGASGQFIIRVRNPGTVFRVLKRLALLSTGTSTWELQAPVPLGPLPAGTDVALTVEAVSANNTGCSGSFTLLLERSIEAFGGLQI